MKKKRRSRGDGGEVVGGEDPVVGDGEEVVGGEDHAHPEDIGIGVVAGWTFGDLAAWGTANAERIAEYGTVPETWDNTLETTYGGVTLTQEISILEYEFGFEVLKAIGHGEPVGEMPATGDTAISMFDADSGLFVVLESSDGFTVSGTEEDPIIEGGITNISVSEGTADAPGDTDILTGTGLSLTFENDIAPLFHSEDDEVETR